MGNLSGNAFLIALSGIVIVFIILAVLCGMIPLISKVVLAIQKPPVRERVASNTSTPAPEAPVPSAGAGNVALIDVDEKTAACIMAIVSHETGIPLSELIFKTIRAI